MWKNPATPVLRTINKVLFGLSWISFFGMFAAGIREKMSQSTSLILEVLYYSWFAFLTLWVLSMIAGFIADLRKRESIALRTSLTISCFTGAAHIGVWFLFFISLL